MRDLPGNVQGRARDTFMRGATRPRELIAWEFPGGLPLAPILSSLVLFHAQESGFHQLTKQTFSVCPEPTTDSTGLSGI